MIKFLPPLPCEIWSNQFWLQHNTGSKMSAATRAYFKNYESALANLGECPGAPQIYGAASPGSHRPGKGIVKRSPPFGRL